MITTEALSRLAASGDTDAAFRLGYRLAFCRAVERRNPKKAVLHWLMAARGGHIRAKYYLGVAYDRGQGVAKNRRAAMRWYAAAAKVGHVEAQYNLALGFRDGTGVRRNASKAVKWLRWLRSKAILRPKATLDTAFLKASALDGISRLLPVGIPKPPRVGSLALNSILVFASATATAFAAVRFARVDGFNAQLAGDTQRHAVSFVDGRITRKWS